MVKNDKPSAATIVCGIVSAVSIAVLIASGVMCMSTFSTYQSTISDLDSDITTQQKVLDTIANTTVFTVDDAKQNSADATSLGQKVAELQNKYIGMTDDSAITSNAAALSEAFSSDAQNARTPWFSYSVMDDAGNLAQWSFKSVTGYSDSDATQLNVVWLCTYGSSDQALAYATATYDPTSNTFSDVATHITMYGHEVIDAETVAEQGDSAATSGQAYNSAVDSIVESLKSGSSDETSDSGPVYPTTE